MANCGRKRIIAAIMALAIVAGAAPAKPISDLFMPELSVSAAEASTSSVSFAGRNVEAGGKLTVKYYFNVAEDFAYGKTAFVKFTCAGKETVVNFTQGVNVNGMLMFEYDLPAKQMADKIKVEVFESTAATKSIYVNDDVYDVSSVKGYAEALIAQGNAATPVLKAMLNYGAYAQTYFKYNTSNLANSSLTAAEKAVSSVTEDTVKDFVPEVIMEGNKTVSAGVYGASASLESETELNMFLHVGTSIKSVKNLAFSCTDGVNEYDVVAEDAVMNDTACYKIKIKGVATKGFGEDLILTATDDIDSTGKAVANATANFVVKCCVNDYIKTAMSYPDEYKSLKDMAAALYLYNQAAVDYFDSVRTVETTIEGTYGDYKEHAYDTAKAFKETVGKDANGKDIEKFLITVPANMVGTNGVGKVEIMYVENGSIKYVPASAIEVRYNSFNGVTTILIDEDEVPAAGTKLIVNASVAEALELITDDGAAAPSTVYYLENLTASNTKVFKGQKFVTVLTPADGKALPGSLTSVESVGTSTTVTLSEGTDYTYNSTTGEVVVFNPTADIKITAAASTSHKLIQSLTNLNAELPENVGDGFATKLTVTDSTKYKVPTKVTLYGGTGVVTAPVGFYSVLNEDGKTRTYYNSANGTEVSGDEVDALTTGYTAAQKEAAQLTDLATLASTNTYYIININEDGSADLAVSQIGNAAGNVVIEAAATEYYDVTVNATGLKPSAAQVKYDPVKKAFVTKDIETTVDEGEAPDEVYFALDTIGETSLILPTSMTVTMGSKTLAVDTAVTTDTVSNPAADTIAADKDYAIVPVTGDTAVTNAEYKLACVKVVFADHFEATDAITIKAAATEQFTFESKLTGNLSISQVDKAYSAGETFEATLTAGANAYLPTSIVITKNGEALVAGYDYTYDSKTGAIKIFNPEKGDKIVLTAVAQQSYSVTINNGNVTVSGNTASVLSGTDYTCTFTLPKYTATNANDDKQYGYSTFEVKVGGTVIDTDSTKSTYYTFNESTGKLTIKNVSGAIVITTMASLEVDLTVAAADDTAALYFKDAGTTYTADADKVFTGNNENVVKVTVKNVPTGKNITGAVKVAGAPLAAANYEFEKSAADEDKIADGEVYILTINPNAIGDGTIGDVELLLGVENAVYALDTTKVDTANKITLTPDSADQAIDGDTSDSDSTLDDYAYNTTLKYKLEAKTGYMLPDSVTVKMGGVTLNSADVYTITKNETGVALNEAFIEIKKVTGEVEIEVVPKVLTAVNSDAVTGDDTDNLTFEIKSSNAVNNYYTPSSTPFQATLAIGGANAYKYDESANAVNVIVADYTTAPTLPVAATAKAINSDGTIINKTEYDAYVAEVSGKSYATTAIKEAAIELAESIPYYTYNSGDLRVYNATGAITIQGIVTLKTPATVWFDTDDDGVYDNSSDSKVNAYYVNDGVNVYYRVESTAITTDLDASLTDLTKVEVTSNFGTKGSIEAVKATGSDAVSYYKITGLTASNITSFEVAVKSTSN